MTISSRMARKKAQGPGEGTRGSRAMRQGGGNVFALAGIFLLGLSGLIHAPASSADEGAPEPAWANTSHENWQLASRSTSEEIVVFVETEPQAGRPAFRLETALEVVPQIAADTLMESMAEESGSSTGERRRLLKRSGAMALVHTYIDLPFMFADRELAVRIDHRVDHTTGTHRIEWHDENEHLPPPEDGVLRLASRGFWEFRPMGMASTRAVYVTRAEVGGSLPAAVGDRMMRKQAVEAVRRLQHLVANRERVQVAAPPPLDLEP